MKSANRQQFRIAIVLVMINEWTATCWRRCKGVHSFSRNHKIDQSAPYGGMRATFFCVIATLYTPYHALMCRFCTGKFSAGSKLFSLHFLRMCGSLQRMPGGLYAIRGNFATRFGCAASVVGSKIKDRDHFWRAYDSAETTGQPHE